MDSDFDWGTQTLQPKEPMYNLPPELIEQHKVKVFAEYLGEIRSIQVQCVPCMPPLKKLAPEPAPQAPCPLSKKKTKEQFKSKFIPPPPPPPKPKPVTPSKTVPKKQGAKGARYYCTHSGCSKSYMKNTDLTRHQNLHLGIPFECSICQKNFSLKKNLVSHLKVHQGEEGHICHVCGKVLSSKTSLKSH